MEPRTPGNELRRLPAMAPLTGPHRYSRTKEPINRTRNIDIRNLQMSPQFPEAQARR
jgi:hypothetical protein